MSSKVIQAAEILNGGNQISLLNPNLVQFENLFGKRKQFVEQTLKKTYVKPGSPQLLKGTGNTETDIYIDNVTGKNNLIANVSNFFDELFVNKLTVNVNAKIEKAEIQNAQISSGNLNTLIDNCQAQLTQLAKDVGSPSFNIVLNTISKQIGDTSSQSKSLQQQILELSKGITPDVSELLSWQKKVRDDNAVISAQNLGGVGTAVLTLIEEVGPTTFNTTLPTLSDQIGNMQNATKSLQQQINDIEIGLSPQLQEVLKWKDEVQSQQPISMDKTGATGANVRNLIDWQNKVQDIFTAENSWQSLGWTGMAVNNLINEGGLYDYDVDEIGNGSFTLFGMFVFQFGKIYMARGQTTTIDLDIPISSVFMCSAACQRQAPIDGTLPWLSGAVVDESGDFYQKIYVYASWSTPAPVELQLGYWWIVGMKY